jgi:hypothetical protein
MPLLSALSNFVIFQIMFCRCFIFTLVVSLCYPKKSLEGEKSYKAENLLGS